MEILKSIFSLIFYYEKDSRSGVPYWRDPTLIGAALGLACTELAKLYGIHIDGDLQLKIVGVITGIGALVSPHTGFVAKPPAEPQDRHNQAAMS